MKVLNKSKYALYDIANLIKKEFLYIATNKSIMLVLIGGVLLYGFLYDYMYQPNTVREVPVVVVDKSNSQLSRKYASLIDASPKVNVYGHQSDMIAAKDLLKESRVAGIIYIPKNFESRVKRGEESIFVSYGVTDPFLYYSSLQEASAGAMMELNKDYRSNMVVFLPQKSVQGIANTKPITISKNALFNFTEGYATYLIPAVLIIVIYQTLFMVIGMITGRERETKSILKYAENGVSFFKMSRIIISKTFVYCIIYGIFSFFLLGLLPYVFGLPNIGLSYNVMIFIIPYLLATCFFALSVSVFFSDSETSVIMIPFFSVGLIFLSGISYPLELMPWYWHTMHFLLPAPIGTLGYVKISSMGASLADVQTEYITLWIQSFVYFILACLAYRHNIKKAMKVSLNSYK